MHNKYDWTEKFKAELDKLDDQLTDNEQVQQLKKIKKLWDKKYKSLMDEMTMMNGESLLIKLHNEIYIDLFQYIGDYIGKANIPMDGIRITLSTIHHDRKKVGVLLNKAQMIIPHTYRLSQNVNAFSAGSVITDMTGIDVRNNTWITTSVYEAFLEVKRKNPDWLQAYCTDITNSLDRIKEESEKSKYTNEDDEW